MLCAIAAPQEAGRTSRGNLDQSWPLTPLGRCWSRVGPADAEARGIVFCDSVKAPDNFISGAFRSFSVAMRTTNDRGLSRQLGLHPGRRRVRNRCLCPYLCPRLCRHVHLTEQLLLK
jgi:hypothetical protein